MCRYSDLEGVRPGPVPPLADGRQGRPTPDNISDNNLLYYGVAVVSYKQVTASRQSSSLSSDT